MRVKVRSSLVVTPVTRSVRSSTTAPVTLACWYNVAPLATAWLASNSSKSALAHRSTRELRRPARQFEGFGAPPHPQALVVQPAGFFADVDAQPQQLLGGPRGQLVAAHLVARKGALFEQCDAQALIGQPAGGGRAGGARPDDDDVRVLVGHAALIGRFAGWAPPV